MLDWILSQLPFGWARRWYAQSDEARIRDWLDFVSAADEALDDWQYAHIERQYPAHLLSEYRREMRKVRNKFARRGMQYVLVRHAQELKLPLTNEQIEVLRREEKAKNRFGEKRDSTPFPPMENDPPREIGK